MASAMAAATAAAPVVRVPDATRLSSSHAVGSFSPLANVPAASRARLNFKGIRSELNQERRSNSLAAQTLAASTLASASLATPALAVDTEAITSVFSQIEDIANQVTSAASTAYDKASEIGGQVVDVLGPLVDAATPVVQQATQSALEIATPFASDVATQAQKALNDAGVDTTPVVEAAKTAATVVSGVTGSTGKAIEVATPVASSTLQTILSLEAPILAAGAGALVLLYLLAPSIFSSVAYAARGYAGELTAAQVLDLLTQTDYTLIDVRSERERGKAGVPVLPRSASGKLISVPVEEVSSKLRGQLRNPKNVEANLAAIKIAALKKLNSNSKIAILDSNGSSAKQVAKSLSSLGFSNTFIVKDGFEGKNGWVQSQLGVEGYSYGQSVVSPSRIIPAAATRIFKRSSPEVVDVPRRGFLLPGGSSDE